MTEYQKFKNLLEYFVSHLEWCENKDRLFEGYDKYIKPLGSNFVKTGLGYKGQVIQDQIKKWELYGNYIACINIIPNYGNYKAKTSYINWKDSWFNVKAIWEDTHIDALYLAKDEEATAKSVMKFSKQELGLFDNKEPNNNLVSFFDKYKSFIMEKQTERYINLLKANKNIILTGAPGTGKTFLAKQIAKQLIGEKTDEELEVSGQFNFVQFHPSYDYTDFVEGLRPTPPDENGIIGFEIKDGIFKSFCQKASEANFSEIVDNFDLAWEGLLATVRKNIAQGVLTTIGSWDYALSSKDSLKYSSLNTPSQYNFTITKKNVYDAFQGKKARPSGAFQKDMVDVVNYLKDNYGLIDFVNKEESLNSGIKCFVFVIDEINRGEISKIFGELFFSIDPSYRGKRGAVKTQYSNLHNDENEVFYVPENVYIIGTMNDIDRSVESFDFAMRRRFTWIEITAEQSAENMGLSEPTKNRMTNLNKAISEIEGLNASYHIGGAYFLDDEGKERSDYPEIWRCRLEPLLKEYLRGMHDGEEKIGRLQLAFNKETIVEE